MTTPPLSRSRTLLLALGLLWLVLAAAIILAQFAGTAQIEIEWVTETEFETAGFNIYRGLTADGPFEQVNNRLLPSDGDAAHGANYSFIDSNVVAGQTYYYRLEEVEYDNSRQKYDIGPGQDPSVELWAVLLAAVSAVVGLFLLVTALKQEKREWIPTEKPPSLSQVSSGNS